MTRGYFSLRSLALLRVWLSLVVVPLGVVELPPALWVVLWFLSYALFAGLQTFWITLLLTLLFWVWHTPVFWVLYLCLFLPWGECASLDRALGGEGVVRYGGGLTVIFFALVGVLLVLSTFQLSLWALVALCCLVVPRSFWDFLQLRVGQQSQKDIKIYYDGDCSFCRKGVEVLRQWLVINLVRVVPAQKVPLVWALMQRRGSWIVTDAEGVNHLGYRGFLCLARLSPWMRFVAGLLSLGAISSLGERVYRWVASHRSALGGVLLRVTVRPRILKLSFAQGVLVCCFGLVLALFFG